MELITCLVTDKAEKFYRITDISVTLEARDYKGFGTYPFNAVIEVYDEH